MLRVVPAPTPLLNDNKEPGPNPIRSELRCFLDEMKVQMGPRPSVPKS